jgi:hypothetical protein
MGRFRTVEVRFLDGTVPRTVVISHRTTVQAVFLNNSEDEFVIRKKGMRRPVQKTREVPVGLTVRPGGKGVLRGPGKVCYLENGILKCWNPS